MPLMSTISEFKRLVVQLHRNFTHIESKHKLTTMPFPFPISHAPSTPVDRHIYQSPFRENTMQPPNNSYAHDIFCFPLCPNTKVMLPGPRKIKFSEPFRHPSAKCIGDQRTHHYSLFLILLGDQTTATPPDIAEGEIAVAVSVD
jgi:hypothetical protein